MADPFIVEPPVAGPPPGEQHGETPEHQWLKQYVRQVAIDLGHHDVQLEAVLTDQVRADVFVPGVVRGRIEIQRGPTHVPERTEGFAEVVWLLRAAFHDTNKRHLFTCPCVQVRIVRREAGRLVLAEPWIDGLDAEVRATGTVLQARADPEPGDRFGFFENEKNVDLARFLGEVWSGRRQWHPQLTAHRFAGWITVEDFARYESWRRPPDPQPVPEPAPELPERLPPGPEPKPATAGVSPRERTWWSRLRRWLFGPR